MYTKILTRLLYILFYLGSLIGAVAVIWFYESFNETGGRFREGWPLDLLLVGTIIPAGVLAMMPFIYYYKKYHGNVLNMMFRFLPVLATCFIAGFLATCKGGPAGFYILVWPILIVMSLYEIAIEDLPKPTCLPRSDPACPG